MTFVFYVSGHGFGHASRDLEVIKAILQCRPDARIVVRSSVPRWFLEAPAIGPLEIEHADTDTGVVQIDSLRLDEDETASRAAEFYRDFDRRVREEAVALRRLGATVVVGDIPPLAFAAAHEAGVPSVALGNFTWDWIYSRYPQFEQLAPGVIAIIGNAYARASLALRLPFHGGFEPMTSVTRDIPLVARRARHARDDVRRTLGFDGDRPIVLASFGGHGLRLPYRAIADQGRFTLVLTDYEAGPPDACGGGLRLFTVRELAAHDLQYADLVTMADVVVTKPGYGIVSECIVNGAALLYTSRGRFAEYDVFVEAMPRVLRCRFIPQEDLLAGRWADAVDGLLQQPLPGDRPELSGHSVAADAILRAAASA
jgi:UDP:flavonoid glycosyltransferase YjiC (YdhE family)